ncbi:hypothetical protein ACOSP7_006852 [Xanthoceras sorbifolium]
MLLGLFSSNGEWKTGVEEMKFVVHEYFSGIFESSLPTFANFYAVTNKMESKMAIGRRNELSSLLGIHVEEQHDRYLSLPNFMGYSRRRGFSVRLPRSMNPTSTLFSG